MTTTVGIRSKDGVVLAADKRASKGFFVGSKVVQKIFSLDGGTAVAIAGAMSDAEYLVNLAKAERRLLALRRGYPLSVKESAQLISNIVYSSMKSYNPFYVELVVAGVDQEGAHVYTSDMSGAITSEDFMSSGSGSPIAYGVLEQGFRKEFSLDQATKLAEAAVRAAMERDPGSGNGVDVLANIVGVPPRVHDVRGPALRSVDPLGRSGQSGYPTHPDRPERDDFQGVRVRDRAVLGRGARDRREGVPPRPHGRRSARPVDAGHRRRERRKVANRTRRHHGRREAIRAPPRTESSRVTNAASSSFSGLAFHSVNIVLLDGHPLDDTASFEVELRPFHVPGNRAIELPVQLLAYRRGEFVLGQPGLPQEFQDRLPHRLVLRLADVDSLLPLRMKRQNLFFHDLAKVPKILSSCAAHSWDNGA